MADNKSHPVRNTVISGLLLAALISLVKLIPGGWEFVGSILQAIYRWLTDSHQVSGWIIVLLAACAIGFLMTMIRIVRQGLIQSMDAQSAYTQDEFFGLKWRWRYIYGDIVEICCFCPNCDQQLEPQSRNTYPRGMEICFSCDHCGWKLDKLDMNWEALQRNVILSIQRKIRTGEWRHQTQPITKKKT